MSFRRQAWSRALLGLGFGAWVAVAACTSSTAPHPKRLSSGTAGAGGNGGSPLIGGVGGGGPPPADAGGFCGNDLHQIVSDTPNIYFVFDTSGSMTTPVGGTTRYGLVRDAAVSVVSRLGALINVGAAHFPDDTSFDACHVGHEIFPVRKGTPGGITSATTLAFAESTVISPAGGTPTAASLEALLPELRKLKGRTIVLLATDGGPNCDQNVLCGADECSVNLDGLCGQLNCCGSNCCDPTIDLHAPLNCVDIAATVAAVSDLQTAGIQVFVIGIPGSEAYSAVLDQMALVGGAPQLASPYYYRVDDLATIDAVFGSIASLVVSCAFTLTNPPKGRGMTNVYFDQTELPYDPAEGWSWTSNDVITLHGAACAELKSGQVSQVQIVSGCPTKVPR